MKNLSLIVLSIFLITSQLSAQNFEFEETKKRKNKKLRLIPRFYGKFETKASLSYDLEKNGRFEVRCGAGDLNIQQSKGDQIEIEALIHTTSLIKKHSKKFMEKYLKLEAQNMGSTFALKSYFEGIPHYGRWGQNNRMSIWRMITVPGSKIHLNIKVPENVKVSVNDKSGSIVISDMKNDLKIDDNSGKLTVKNVIGDVEIKDQSGSMSVKNIQGDLEIKDGSGDIELSQIGWDTKIKAYTNINDRSGKVVINEVSGDLKVNDLSGSIGVSKVSGDVVIKDSSGSIDVNKIGGALEVNDSSGGIKLKEIAYNEGQIPYIRITDTSGRVRAEDLGTDTVVKDSSGRIIIRKVNGNLEIRDQSGRIITSEINGRLAVRDRSGKIKSDTYMVKN